MKKAILCLSVLIFNFIPFDLVLALETDLIISEIMYDLAGADSQHEWIEVYNSGTEDLEVITGSGGTAWRFFDSANHTLKLYQGNNIITAQQYFVLADNAEQFLLDYPDFSGTVFDTVMSLNNSSSTLSLSFDGGKTYPVQASYESSWGANGNGFSLERISLTADSGWQESSVIGGTPGRASDIVDEEETEEEGGDEEEEDDSEDDSGEDDSEDEEEVVEETEAVIDPGKGVNQEIISWQQIIISEFLPNPSGNDDHEWIELYNRGPRDVDLAGFALQDNSTRLFTLAEVSILANQYLVIDKEVSKVSLNNSGGDSVKLYNPNGELLEMISYEDSAVENRSYARNGNNFVWTIEPSPGTENIFVANQNPQAKIILKSEDLVVGTKIVLSGEESSDPEEGQLTYLWDFGDETSGDEKTENHIYEAAGSYLVKLIVSDSEGVKDETTLLLAIEDLSTELELTDISPINFVLQDLIIAEFIPNPVGSDDHEWIEIYNASSQEINLAGWQLDDQEGGSKPYTFPAETSIAPQEFLVISRDDSKLTLNNSEDEVRLLTPLQEVWQSVSYTNVLEGQSQAWDFNNQEWFVNPTPSPGADNLVLANQVVIQTIEEVKGFDKNTEVVVRGVALNEAANTRSLYLVDYDGQNIYYDSILELYSYAKEFPDIKAGELIEAKGKISKTGPLVRVKITEIVQLGVAVDLILPEAINLNDLNEDLLGTFLTVQGVIVKKNGKNIYLADELEKDYQLRVYTDFDTKELELKKEIEMIVSGILINTDSGFKLLPRQINDLLVSKIVLGTKEEQTEENTNLANTSTNYGFFVERGKIVKNILLFIICGVIIIGIIYLVKKKRAVSY